MTTLPTNEQYARDLELQVEDIVVGASIKGSYVPKGHCQGCREHAIPSYRTEIFENTEEGVTKHTTWHAQGSLEFLAWKSEENNKEAKKDYRLRQAIEAGAGILTAGFAVLSAYHGDPELAQILSFISGAMIVSTGLEEFLYRTGPETQAWRKHEAQRT